MINHYDVLYLGGLGISSPVWLLKSSSRQKVLHALGNRLGQRIPQTNHETGGRRPCVMIHAVSVGEINAAAALIRELASARPDMRLIISSTTQTGYERAMEVYGK